MKHSGFHRIDRAIENAGNLAVPHLVAVGQVDHRPMVGGKFPHRPDQQGVRAGLSDPGPAGAEGRGSRFIYVRDVLEARRAPYAAARAGEAPRAHAAICPI